MPQAPQDLAQHDCVLLRHTDGQVRSWQLWCPDAPRQIIETKVAPVVVANHTDTLLRAALDGAGITSISMDIVAPYLTSGTLVRVLNPWIAGRLAMYAALPGRKFVPERLRVFLDYLVEHTREQTEEALKACAVC